MKSEFLNSAVLGRILLLQSAVEAAPDEQRMIEMLVGEISTFAGIKGAFVCLGGGRFVASSGFALPEACCVAHTNSQSPKLCSSECPLHSKGYNWFHQLLAGGCSIGWLGIRVAEDGRFQAVEPFIANTGNLLALHILNRRQSLELEAFNRELEQKVACRTAALSASESKYRTLVETLPQCIFVKDKNSVYISCNAQYAQNLSISPEEIVGKDDYAFHPKELADQYRADDQSVMASGMSREIEERYIKDGETRWAITTKTPMYDSDGRISGIVGVFADITERKRMEEVLHETSGKLNSILQSISDAFFSMDDQLVVTYFNTAAERVLHCSSRDVLGKYLFDVFPEARGSIFDEKYHQAVRDKVFLSFEAFFDVEPYRNWYEVRVYPQTEGISVYFQVVTDRKLAEEALRESENKLSALFEAMTEMVVLHELIFDNEANPINYRITDCNRAFIKITGLSREKVIGQLATVVYGTEQAPYFNEFKKVALTGNPYIFETFYTPMDKYFHISVVSPGKNRFATITTDVTALKQAEQVISAKNKDLEQIIYIASHDLRSPLVNLEGYSRELEYCVAEFAALFEDGKTVDPAKLMAMMEAALPEFNNSLHHIRHGAKQMDALLKGLLKLSRSGRAALNICTVDMNKLVARAISSIDFQAKQAGVKIQIGELPFCKADEVQVTQVITNLLSNALKFLDPNRPGVIRISGSIEHNRSIYCVADNGIGIPSQHQEKIFELFHRLNPSKSDGEGLGLTIVRQILGRLEGEVRVVSQPGEGSRFIVSLPNAPALTQPGKDVLQ